MVATDDTIMPMLKKDKAAKARMWGYVADEDNAYNVFDFTLNRGRDGPKYFLKHYREISLADAYAGYNGVVAGNEITRAGCWAHARRKVVEAEKAAPAIAREAVEQVCLLYAVERQARDLSVEARLRLRQSDAAPVLAGFKDKLLDWKKQLLPKHPMAEAVGYILGRWEELNVYCNDGAVPIDNKVSEREMKRVVLNRKNSLFVGNANKGRSNNRPHADRVSGGWWRSKSRPPPSKIKQTRQVRCIFATPGRCSRWKCMRGSGGPCRWTG